MAVFASLPPPVTNEDALLPQYLCADSLPAFRVWRLLGVVLAMIPKLTTLFLVLGRSMPAPTYQQYLIDRTLGGGGTAEERANVFRATHQSCEFLAIRVLVMEHIPISIGYPVLPELQVLVLDHISDCAPLFDTYGGEKIVDDLRELCPQLRYIQTKGYLHHRRIRATVRSTSMRSLLLRKTRFLMAELPYIQTAHPNLTSLRIVIFSETGDDSIVHSFEALGKLRYLQYLSVTTPHDLSWHVFDLAPSMSLTMSPFLRGMEYLQHLRVDFIWLAARSNPSQLFHIASLLPPSIKSLHLLDYWGIAITSGLPERYPGFPDDMPAIDFIHLVLEHLLESFTSMGLTSLREVKLSSKEYAKDRWRTTAIRASLNSLTWRFWRAGICFTVTGLEEAREEEDGWWLNLD
jgi:hypothetical protein